MFLVTNLIVFLLSTIPLTATFAFGRGKTPILIITLITIPGMAAVFACVTAGIGFRLLELQPAWKNFMIAYLTGVVIMLVSFLLGREISFRMFVAQFFVEAQAWIVTRNKQMYKEDVFVASAWVTSMFVPSVTGFLMNSPTSLIVPVPAFIAFSGIVTMMSCAYITGRGKAHLLGYFYQVLIGSLALACYVCLLYPYILPAGVLLSWINYKTEPLGGINLPHYFLVTYFGSAFVMAALYFWGGWRAVKYGGMNFRL